MTQETKQYRRHDRARIKCQKERTYYFEGKSVAKNRHKRTGQSHAGRITEQAYDSLEEWYAKQVKEHGVREAEKHRSRLTVKKSTRSYNRMDRILPRALFKYKGHRYVMSGQITGGEYFRAEGQGKRNFPTKACEILTENRGIAYL